MNGLSHVYGCVVRARNALYDREILRAQRLQAPVISVGNLSVGGAGKTPFVILLGEMLRERGIAFNVLSRGYGRRSRGTLVVDPSGSPREFGDEPLLIARRLGVNVVVGESRYEAGVYAERTFGATLNLLDDGFQHRALARDFEIVLVTAEDATGQLLPSGRLREPLRSLRRADAVVLTGNAEAESFPVQGKMVWRVRRGIEMGAAPSRPVVFCGIARPKVFLEQLEEQEVRPVATQFFRDHHFYDRREIEELQRLGKEHGAGGFITTEKDAVNLGELRGLLEPLTVVGVTMQLESYNAIDAMLRVIAERTAGRERIS